MANVYFLHQIKHTSGNWEKVIVVKFDEVNSKENYNSTLQRYYA